MHRSKPLRLAILLPAIAVLGSSLALAQPDPGDIARACIEQLRRLSTDCARTLLQIGDRAAQRINHLQAQGHDRMARAVAFAAHRRVTEIAHGCLNRLDRITRECLAALNHLGAPDEMKRAVLEVSARAHHRVRAAARAAHERIARALHD